MTKTITEQIADRIRIARKIKKQATARIHSNSEEAAKRQVEIGTSMDRVDRQLAKSPRDPKLRRLRRGLEHAHAVVEGIQNYSTAIKELDSGKPGPNRPRSGMRKSLGIKHFVTSFFVRPRKDP
jgi:hypothetical protein